MRQRVGSEAEGGEVAWQAPRDLRSGTFANGMEFLTWGSGPKTLLFLPGGPGSAVPSGMLSRMSRRWFDPFVEAGYAIWYVTRRRNMPEGHSVEDMADDYAHVISEELGGRVDLVVGESYGGMIAQYLAALHGESVGSRRHRGRRGRGQRLGQAGGLPPCRRARPGRHGRLRGGLRRVRPSGRARAGGSAASSAPGSAAACSRGRTTRPRTSRSRRRRRSRSTPGRCSPGIEKPVLLICGDRDRFFPREVVEETVRLIPDCTLVLYEGQGHMRGGRQQTRGT